MPARPTDSLETVFPGLRSTPPSVLPYDAEILVRSFLLERPAGNVIIYNSPGITSAAAHIRDAGGATRLLINHSHEAMYGDTAVEVPVFVHERDRAEAARSMHVAGAITERQMIDDDLEVIPTPGHTAGTTSYLWDNGEHRFLFTGDFVSIDHGGWRGVLLDPSLRAPYLESLALIRELDFDVLVPWGATDDGPSVTLVDRAEARARLDALVERIQAGGDR